MPPCCQTCGTYHDRWCLCPPCPRCGTRYSSAACAHKACYRREPVAVSQSATPTTEEGHSMAESQVTVIRRQPEPVTPPIEKVILELTEDQAERITTLLGRVTLASGGSGGIYGALYDAGLGRKYVVRTAIVMDRKT